MKSKTDASLALISIETVVSKIFVVRGKKIMLDKDLADLYGVETRALNQAVKRNIERFPSDFMFQLDENETEALVSQNVTPSKSFFGGHSPYVFTEQGVAMLSSVLKSSRAIQVNIQIIRTFTKLREIMASNRDLREKVDKLEREYDKHILSIFEAIKKLQQWQNAREYIENKPKGPIGFRTDKQSDDEEK